MTDEKFYHLPVFKIEATENLVWNKNGIYVDGTLGGGGHAEEILQKISVTGKLIAIDQDEDAINYSKNKFSKYKNQIQFKKSNFSNIKSILQELSIDKIDGILLDLGVSSFQINETSRGFSFMNESKLDMRMDQSADLTAEEILNKYPEKELANIFHNFGEVRESNILSKLIVKSREKRKFESSADLKSLVEKNFKGPFVTKLLAKIFQSIRIKINNELVVLENCLNNVFPFLNSNGRMVVISYHSLEDRIVKNFFNQKANPKVETNIFSKTNFGIPEIKIITKKPLIPSEKEIELNSRARSAKMRIAEKI